MPPPNTPRLSSRSDPAGMGIEYNHDLDVSEKFLLKYAPIRDSLRDQRVIDEFQRYDQLAKRYKRRFHLLGLCSLIFGLFSLSAAAMQMILGEVQSGRFHWLWNVAEICGCASVLLILWERFGRYRVNWCRAVFCRERIRQWHFQKFLDGSLLELLIVNRPEFDREIEERWNELQENFRDGFGMMAEFVDSASPGSDFFYRRVSYQDSALAGKVFGALDTLRFEHQLRYSARKTKPGEAAGLALKEQTSLSETVASSTLGGAILVSALSLVFSLGVPAAAAPWQPDVISRILNGCALFLAVFSAASRAYRAGLTLPDELESYDEYSDRLHELKAVFDDAPRDDERLRHLEQLEEAVVAELRRFLRMKMRATFVF